MFKPAEKVKSLLRAALIGPSGSGKTYTALEMAKVLAPSGRVALVDTEHGSASKYADLFKFDVLELDNFAPKNYIEAIAEAEKAGYELLILDSLSHAWAGKGGILEFVDTETSKSKSGNAFTTGWRKATPEHNKLVEAILASRLHVIATMRSKVKYILEDDGRGHQAPKKVGMEPVQREGMEYEFDVVADMNMDNLLIIGKTRCPALAGKSYDKPTTEPALTLKNWLENGAPAPAQEKKPEPTKPAAGTQPSTQTAKALTPDERNAVYEKIAVGFRDLLPISDNPTLTDDRLIRARLAFVEDTYKVKDLAGIPDERLQRLALAVSAEGPEKHKALIAEFVAKWETDNPIAAEPDPLDAALGTEKQKEIAEMWSQLRANCSSSILKKLEKQAEKYKDDPAKLIDYLNAAILGEKQQAEQEGKEWK
jgi:hypothetical protein